MTAKPSASNGPIPEVTEENLRAALKAKMANKKDDLNMTPDEANKFEKVSLFRCLFLRAGAFWQTDCFPLARCILLFTYLMLFYHSLASFQAFGDPEFRKLMADYVS